jgi:transposase
MKHYAGLDVSLKLTAICIVDQTGQIAREGMVASNPEAIAAFVKLHAPHVERIGLESGATSTWLWTELNNMGLPVICIDARHAKAALKMQINKSDRNDAVGIARIMQCGWYKEVRVKGLDSHAIKALLVSRALLVKIKRDLENQIRGLLKNLGLIIGRGEDERVYRACSGAYRGSARARRHSRAAAQGTRGHRGADCTSRPQGHAACAQRCSSATVHDSAWCRRNYGTLLPCHHR